MKLYKYVALFLFMCSAQALTAQERPYNSMIFRSQIFDNGHQPVKNEKLNVEVELFTKDKVWYSETQQINTNNEGYVFIQVGKGSLISGKFNEVPFSNQEISLRIKYKVLDSNGNASGDYVQLQSTDLYAVPYAFHALTAESLADKDTAQLPSDSGQGGTSSDSNSTLASKGNTWSVYGNKYIGMRGGFLGTVDDSPLNLKTNNQTRINITPDGKINFLGDVNLANTNTLTVTNLTTDHLTANNAAVNNLVAQTGVIESTTQSTNPDNGALIIKGGAGIKKNLNVGENLTVYNTTNLLGDMKVNGTARFSEKAEFDKQVKINDATESNTLNEGSVVTAGGASIAKNLNVGGNMKLSGNSAIDQNLVIGQNTIINGADNATNKDHGALIIESGGLGVEKDIVSGGTIHSNTDIVADHNLSVANTSNLNTLNVAGNTTLLGVTKIQNNTFSSTPLEGALVVDGGVGIGENLNVNKNANITENLTAKNITVSNAFQVNGTADAVDQNSGALIVADGGLGVEKNIYSGKDIVAVKNITANENLIAAKDTNVGQNLNVVNKTTTSALDVANAATIGGITTITNATHSTNTTSGALVVNGGVGVNENINIGNDINAGGNLNITKNANITENLTAKNIAASNGFQVNGDADAVDQNSGALVVAGGLGVGKNIYSGKDITASKNITANENLISTKDTNVGQNLTVAVSTTTSSLNVNNAATIGGITTITNATHSTNATSGALVVNGGVGVNENINIGNDINAGGNLNITKNANITENLTAKNVTASNGFQVNGDADAVDQNSGALVVAGGLGVGKNIYSGKDITASKNITANENLTSTKNTNVGQNLTVGLSTTTSSLNVNNAATIGGITTITNATHSTNAASGALVVNGGVGVSENINIGNDISAGGNLNITKNANITENLTAKNIAVSNGFQVNGDADAVDQNSGALVVAGGLGVGKNIYSGKDIVAVKNITANENLTSTKNTNVGQNLTVGLSTTTSSLNVNNAATIGGITTITNATHSTNATSGALVVNGGVGIKEDMNIGEDISVTGNTNLNGNLYTNKKSTFNDDALFNKQMNINSTIDDDNDKALEVTGGAIIGKRLHIKSTISQPYGSFTDAALKVDGGAIINGNLSVLGQVFTQNATINTLTPLSVDTYTYYSNPYQRPLLNGIGYGPDNLYNSYAIRINAVDQGIAIKVNKHAESNHGAAYGSENSANATTGNNFMSFWNKDGNMIGRIEAETLPELTNFGKEYLRTVKKVELETAKVALISTFKTIESTLEAIEIAKSDLTKSTATGLLSITGFTPTGGPLVDGKSSAASSAQFQKAEKEMNAAGRFAAKVASFVTDGEITSEKVTLYSDQLTQLRNTVGVKYSSSAGDYAEYLELMDYNDSKKLIPAQVVGVKGGKISLTTEDCDKIMVISMNPAVVGKQPSKENEHKFKPVAFMGQVPVFVLNRAKIGDYLVPSGNNDGYAIAKSPDQMSVDDYKKIIGIAWEETNASKTINVAVGINANDVVDLIKNQNKKIDLLEEKMNRIEKYLAQNSGEAFSVKDSDQKTDNSELVLSGVEKSLKNNNDFMKIASAIAEKLKAKNINALQNKEMYIENEINNYFAGMFFDKKFTNDLNEKEQKLINLYLKGATENIKNMLQ